MDIEEYLGGMAPQLYGNADLPAFITDPDYDDGYRMPVPKAGTLRLSNAGLMPQFYWQDMMQTQGLIGMEFHMVLPEADGSFPPPNSARDIVIFKEGERGD